MELSEKAKEDLRRVLVREIGADRARNLSSEELNKLGGLFLSILAENLKMNVANPELLTSARG